jgi:hypothetical protein
VEVCGALQNLRSQLENMKGEVDRVLAIVDEGLAFIRPERVSILEHADLIKKKPMYSKRAQPKPNSAG